MIARSKRAKAIGIPMGAALHEVHDPVNRHHVAVCSGNFAVYGDVSA